MKELPGFALVGCGRIAKRYAELLTAVGRPGRLIAVCDVQSARANSFADTYGVPAYADMHSMAAAHLKEIDCFCILTPSGLHAKHFHELVPYGRHILVEKPMALRVDDAEEMISSASRADIRLFVVKQNRYNVPVIKLREAVDAGRFGKITMGTVRVRWCRSQHYYDQDAWRGTWSLDGGVFANQASHHIDLLTWCLGSPTMVHAVASTALAKTETEDTGIAIVRFESGALGLVEATTATRPEDLEGSISILGEHGTVEIGGFAVNEMKTWLFDSPEPGDEDVPQNHRENPPDVYGFGHRRYLEGVARSLSGETEPEVGGPEALSSLRVVCGIYRSIETGGWVNLNEDDLTSRLGRS